MHAPGLKFFSAIFLLPSLGLGQGSIHINFDRPPDGITSNTTYVVTSYSEAGMWFRSNPDFPGFAWRGSDSPFWPTDGTPYLHAAAGQPLFFGFDNGSLFSLNRVSLAGYSTASPNIGVDFIGHRADGSTVTQNFQVQGITFAPHLFGSGWSGLSWVEINSPEWVLDDLFVTAAVPEPSFSLVLCAGLAIWAARVRFRK
jgi:hypothetical protein